MANTREEIEKQLGELIIARMSNFYRGTQGFAEKYFADLGYGHPDSSLPYLSNLRQGRIRGHSGTPTDLDRQLLRLSIVLHRLNLGSSGIINEIRSLEPYFVFPPMVLSVPQLTKPKKSLERRLAQS